MSTNHQDDINNTQNNQSNTTTATASTNHNSSQQGHVASPTLLRDRSTFESLTSTLRTWRAPHPHTPAQFTPITQQQPVSPSASSSTSPRFHHTLLSPTSPSLLVDDQSHSFNNNSNNIMNHPAASSFPQQSDHDRDDRSIQSHSAQSRHDDKILWGTWDNLPQDISSPNSSERRILILAYQYAGLSIWDCSTLDSWFEILNHASINSLLPIQLSATYPNGIGVIVAASVLPSPLPSSKSTQTPQQRDPWQASRPLLAILARQESTSHLVLYSLRTHSVLHDVPLGQGIAHDLQTTSRHVVISTTSPLALHVLDSTTLLPLPFSPLTDLFPSPFDEGQPVFHLGKGGRMLAYATDRPVTPSSRQQQTGNVARPGAGTISLRGMFDSEHSSEGFGASSPPAGIFGGAAGGAASGASSVESSFGGVVGGAAGGFMGEAGQVGGEVARRVGEGLVSGVRAIGDIGLSYWLTKSSSSGGPPPQPQTPRLSPGGTGTGSDISGSTTPGRNFSKSAPLPSVAGFERRSPTLAPQSNAAGNAAAGTVVVVDLLSFSTSASTAALKPSSTRRRPSSSGPALKVLAHFRPSAHPLAVLSLSPSSSFLLTSSAQAHSFDVFEIKPAVKVGVSATLAVAGGTPAGGAENRGPGGGSEVGKVWHRYRLSRGFTSARATSASWSPDMRFVTISTGKGTIHVYAIQPFGGKPNFSNHFAPRVSNSLELQPLSVTLSTITRIRPSSRESATEESDSYPSPGSVPASLVFISKSDSLSSSFRHSPHPVTKPVSPPSPHAFLRGGPRSPVTASTNSATPVFQDCAVLYPGTGSCVLSRLTVQSGNNLSSFDANGGLDVGRLATTAVSGLSQLMKARGNAAPEPDWVVSCSAKAEWNVARQSGWGEVEEDLTESATEGSAELRRTRSNTVRYSAEAEIETFSRSPRVLPRSIYQSQQFDFFALPHGHLDKTNAGRFDLPLRRLEMRSEVHIRQGNSNPHDQHHGDENEPVSFDQPIRSAMQTILDSEGALTTGSPKTLTPTFPNGVAGKQGRWRDALPIRNMVPPNVVNEGFGRMRKELGRVRVSASSIVPRRRASSSGAYYGHAPDATYSSSISFEDDDAVFADRIHSESGSTACTSEQEVDDDLSWALEEEPAIDASSPNAHDEVPFEDDFEDFVLDHENTSKVSGLVSSKDTLLSLPVPIAGATGIGGPGSTSSFGSFDPSPAQKESHLISISTSPTPSSAGSKKSRRKKGAHSPAFC
ncbi:hypothetical protein T439DRAFT_79576 [Meredithblackwellia eburnea MCA 4105]